jgi:transcription elongation factor Elf1
MRPLTVPTGQAQILKQAAGPQEGTPVAIARRRFSLMTTTEGEAANDIPVPVLQPREVRLRVHREEIRCRQPAVQGVRADVPDEHQLYVPTQYLWKTGRECQTLIANAVDLSAPVDVYADWIDACDAVAKEAAAGRTATERSADRTGALPKPVDDDDGFIENDDLDAEGDYDG